MPVDRISQVNSTVETVSLLEVPGSPATKSKVQARDESSLISLKSTTPAQTQAQQGILGSVGETISSFFSSITGWIWGSTPTTTMPTDLKPEGGSTEGISSRPTLSKPEAQNHARAMAAMRETNNRVQKINDEKKEEIEAEKFDPKNFNEVQLMKMIAAVLKEQKENQTITATILYEKMKEQYKSAEDLKKHKEEINNSIDSCNTILNVTGIIGTVGYIATGAGLLITGVLAVTTGVGAIPAAYLFAQGAAGVITACNQLAHSIVQQKNKSHRGEFDRLNNLQKLAHTIGQMTAGDITKATQSAVDAEKKLLEMAQKQYQITSNIMK